MPIRRPQFPGTIRVIIILCTVVAVLGCSFMQSLFPGEENPPGEGPSDSSSVGQEPVEINILSESYEPLQYEFPDLGSISFQADTTSGTSRQVSPEDSLVEMQLVDAAGLTWALTIPAGALETTQTLKMFPLTELQSSAVPGLVSGIVLEPDGLEFRLPLRLSVSGPGLDEHTLILSGNHSGDEVDYALHDLTAPEATAEILHFSSYFASRPSNPELQGIHKQYSEQYLQALKEADKLLKKGIEVPAPPSIPLECADAKTGQKNGEKIDQFVNKAMEPERQLINRMLSIRSVLARTGVGDADQVGDVEHRLISRLYHKASQLMNLNQGNEEKLLAVTTFSFQVARMLQLSGAASERSTELLERLAVWHDRLVERLIEDIGQKHNYKKIPAVLFVARNAQLLGAENRTEAILERLQNVLKFEVQINFDVHLPDEAWVTDSKVKVQFEANSLTTCQGTGQGMYTSATSPNAVITAPAYPVQVKIKDFNPCEGTVTVGFDRFGAQNETYTIETDDEQIVLDMPLVQNSGESLYGDHAEGGLYSFAMEVDNGNPIAAEKRFEQSKFGKVYGVLTIKLVHTPR
jgi:hypothetical protein